MTDINDISSYISHAAYAGVEVQIVRVMIRYTDTEIKKLVNYSHTSTSIFHREHLFRPGIRTPDLSLLIPKVLICYVSLVLLLWCYELQSRIPFNRVY